MRAHGWAEMELQDRILFIRPQGAWNIEALQLLMNDIRRHAEELRGSPWAILYDVRDWKLITPDVLKAFRGFTQEMDAMDRTHVAVISGNHLLLKSVVRDLSEDMRAKEQFFENEEDARAWLTIEGFEATKQ